MHTYTRDLGNYICSTLTLTMAEEGAYIRLLDQYYAGERALPVDRNQLYRMARALTAAERKAVDRVLGLFFAAEEDGYRHGDAERDIGERKEKQARAERIAQARRGRRKATGDACEDDATGDANGHANAMQNGCKTDAHQTPDTNHHAPGTTSTLRRALPIPSQDTRQAGSLQDGKGVEGVPLKNEIIQPLASGMPTVSGTPQSDRRQAGPERNIDPRGGHGDTWH